MRSNGVACRRCSNTGRGPQLHRFADHAERQGLWCWREMCSGSHGWRPASWMEYWIDAEEITCMCTCKDTWERAKAVKSLLWKQADRCRSAHIFLQIKDRMIWIQKSPLSFSMLKPYPLCFFCQPYIQRRAKLNDSEHRAGKEHLHVTECSSPSKSLPVVKRHKQMGAINYFPLYCSLALYWLPKRFGLMETNKKDAYRDRILLFLSQGASTPSPRFLHGLQIDTKLNPFSFG